MNFSLKKFKNYIQFNKKPLSKKNGFTLIELIVVLAILGILIAIATPNLKYFVSESEETSLDTQTQAVYNVVVNKLIDSTGTNVTEVLNFDKNPDLFSLQNLYKDDVYFEFTTSVDTTPNNIKRLTSAHPDQYIIIIPVIDTVDFYPNFTQDVVIVQPNSNVMFINGVKF